MPPNLTRRTPAPPVCVVCRYEGVQERSPGGASGSFWMTMLESHRLYRPGSSQYYFVPRRLGNMIGLLVYTSNDATGKSPCRPFHPCL